MPTFFKTKKTGLGSLGIWNWFETELTFLPGTILGENIYEMIWSNFVLNLFQTNWKLYIWNRLFGGLDKKWIVAATLCLFILFV